MDNLAVPEIAIIGAGRLGTALAAALTDAGVSVSGPFRRNESVTSHIVILAVPDREIAAVARVLPASALVGHCSASAPLSAMAPHECFNCHPLMTLNAVRATTHANAFRGAVCAIDGSTDRARQLATTLADILGMRPVHVPASRRAVYHAAATMASNYLVTLETAAETLAKHAGLTRAELAPLARAALEAWIAGGFPHAISGPVSRGDMETVQAQREAVGSAAPELLPLFDALTTHTRACL
jgi:predicted short-subunit dehydrogenase-like oxidoreductase (DUF2520 family)